MLDDTSKLNGIVEIIVNFTDTKGPREVSCLIDCSNKTLGEIGTWVQREVYEMLRKVADTNGKENKR